MASSGNTPHGAVVGDNLDDLVLPLSPLFFVTSPEPCVPIMDCLEIPSLPMSEMESNQPVENDPIPVVSDASLSPQQNTLTNQAPPQNPDVQVYDPFLDPSTNNFSNAQQRLENPYEIYPQNNLPMGPSGQMQQQPFMCPTTAAYSEVPVLGRTYPYDPIMIENNQQIVQANIVGSGEQFNAFEFPSYFQAQPQQPLIQEMDHPNQLSSVYDQLVRNFSNNNQAVPNPRETRGYVNMQMQRQNPLYMPTSSTQGPWPSNLQSSFDNQTSNFIVNPECYNPMLLNSIIPNNRQHNYPLYSPYQYDQFLPIPNPYAPQDFSSYPMARPNFISTPLQPERFNGYSSASALAAVEEEPLALRMVRASARIRGLYGQSHPHPAVNQRTYALLNQASATPSLMDPLQDIPLVPRSQAFFGSTRMHNTQGLVNQPPRTSSLYNGLGNQQQNTYTTSTTQEVGGHLNEQSSTRNPVNGRSTINKNKDKGILRQRGYNKDQFEYGQSSKRRRIFVQGESSRPELPMASLSQDESFGPTHPFDDRPAKNAVYDPIYEGVGLPVDPHLRLFDRS